MKTLIKSGTLVTCDKKNQILNKDILINNQFIEKIEENIPEENHFVLDAKNCLVIPGLIQNHVHLCQVLFRGEADDLSLIDWLSKKIWPMESSHNKNSLYYSALLGLIEMQKSGTTSILDMGTIHNADVLFQAALESGMRYWGGNCLMDLKNKFLQQPTNEAIHEIERLIEKFHKSHELINYVLCPRFVVSCSEKLLKEVKKIQDKHNLLIHIHASESLEEIKIVKKMTGLSNINYLDKLGFLNKNTIIIHGVHIEKKELKKIIRSKTKLVHCPSANLKLASGFAPIHKYIEEGAIVGIGSDGAPCNNTHDLFKEVHLAALIQKPLFGPKSLNAKTAFSLATSQGSKVLQMENKIGSIKEGHFADLVVVEQNQAQNITVKNPISSLVYSTSGRDVRDVMIHGKWVVKNKNVTWIDEQEVFRLAKAEKENLINQI